MRSIGNYTRVMFCAGGKNICDRARCAIARISSVILLGFILSAAGSPITLSAVAQEGDHQYRTEDVQAGYRLYTSRCQLCHGPNGDMIGGVNLSRQQFHRAVSDDDIRNTIRRGTPAGMPAFDLDAGQINSLVAYVRSGFSVDGSAAVIGDASQGQRIYAQLGCAGCHQIRGSGSRKAPDLTDIGAIRQAAVIRKSLLEPGTVTQPINRSVHIVMKNGQELSGRRLNEDTFTVQLIDGSEALRSIPKAEIRSYQVLPSSGMPSFKDRLTDAQTADLLAYLVNQRGL